MPKITFDVRRYQPFKADLVARTAMTRTVSLENWPGTVRAPSQEGQGRKLWKKKDAEDEDKDQENKPRDRRF